MAENTLNVLGKAVFNNDANAHRKLYSLAGEFDIIDADYRSKRIEAVDAYRLVRALIYKEETTNNSTS